MARPPFFVLAEPGPPAAIPHPLAGSTWTGSEREPGVRGDERGRHHYLAAAVPAQPCNRKSAAAMLWVPLFRAPKLTQIQITTDRVLWPHR